MSTGTRDAASTVLFDVPGPIALRRYRILSAMAGAVLAGLVGYVVWRLARAGQFSAARWGPLVDPSHEAFRPVWRLIGRGLRATLVAAGLAIVCSLVLGTLLGVVRMMLGRWGRIPLVAVMELLRGLPVVITIFFASRVLPDLGISVAGLPGTDGLWYLVIGLTAYNMVILAEIVRAGVAALPRGQREAALAVGLTPWQSMRLVLLPQAFRVMLPAVISQLVVVLKDTSLAAVLGIYTELLRQANLIAQNLDNRIPMLLLVGAIFIGLNYSLGRLAEWVERRLSRAQTPSEQTVAVEQMRLTGA
jgi:glutamate transport system permease protein